MLYTTTKTSQLSFAKKLLIIFCFFITIITLLNFISHNKKVVHVTVSTSTLKSLRSFASEINSNQCQLSLKESDGWFCEFDADWKRRKTLHHIQDKRNRVSNSRDQFFQNNWEPTVHCEFDRRLGSVGDGGKWICDIHRFEQMNTTDLLIYSFGSRGEFSFELTLKAQFPKSEIHTFDMGLYQCPSNVCTFHQARLGNGKNDGSKSLRMVMNELGHSNRQIHILKVDIEGSEFDLFEELFNPLLKNQTNVPYIRQILFEIHLASGFSDEPCHRTHRLFELFRANNYAIFHKEANLFSAQTVFEYALIRLNPAFFISPI